MDPGDGGSGSQRVTPPLALRRDRRNAAARGDYGSGGGGQPTVQAPAGTPNDPCQGVRAPSGRPASPQRINPCNGPTCANVSRIEAWRPRSAAASNAPAQGPPRRAVLRWYLPRGCTPAPSGRAASGLPGEMTRLRRWVRHSSTKVPLTAEGRPASSTNPATWSTLAEAEPSTRGRGLGFVPAGEGIACIDIDRCIDATRELAPWAQRLVETAGPTYVEFSPSSRGIHIWGRGDLERGRVVTVGGIGNAAMYSTGRYITVTRRALRHARSRLVQLDPLINRLLR